MHLSGFKIKNFRSIVDSGWNTLASDNITALIGQNESGKTSVLEALYSFYKGSISEDVLRSDLTMPEVSCSFTLAEGESFGYIESIEVPAGIIAEIKKSREITLTRIWFSDMTNQIILAGVNISGIFDKTEEAKRLLKEECIEKLQGFFKDHENIHVSLEKDKDIISLLKKELEQVNKKLDDLKKLIKRSSDISRLEMSKRDMQVAENEQIKILDDIKCKEESLYKKQSDLEAKDLIKSYGEECLELLDALEKTKPELDKAYSEVSEVENSLAYLKSKKENKAAEIKLFASRENYIRISRKAEILKEKTGVILILVKKLMEGKDLQESETEARGEFESQKSMLSRGQAGEVIFRYLPRFEFFEDFSSLLPNRIDLEHIFENNNRVEGYKAVRNFLVVAGLDPEFFKQSNNRILKQKIENLNNEVTVDFQEYWQQNVGKTNKIRINFELEHYDISHSEKRGKPYLEFWIKDQHERLYPKQRSRGVRWFLSFYLELKAFANENSNQQRILLIDEPGLSLHARAQEDVLRVFENIKNKIQILYSTHSPHLIDHNKLHRLLAVQRANHNSELSETIIFDASHLHSASSDTLSPVCTLMGTGLTRQQIVKQSTNIIVEDICSYYYLSALYKLTANPGNVYFLPANGPAGVTTLVNLLTGWGFDFSVLLFDNEETHLIINELKLNSAGFEQENTGSRLIFRENFCSPEDLFSTLDFKKYLIKKRGGISGSNSGFLNNHEISRPLLAADFSQSITAGNFSINDFDEETRHNLNDLFDSLSKRIMISDET